MTISILSPLHKFMGVADGTLLNWCPTLNLITVVINKTSVWVYRLDGERIYSVNNKSPIISITFMKTGLYFCLAGIDGKIKIYDSNNGKLVNVLDSNFDQIKLINWNFHSYKPYHRFDDLFKVDIIDNLPRLSLDNKEDDSNSTSSHSHGHHHEVDFLTIIDDHRLCINFNNLLIIDDIPLLSDIEFTHHLNNNDLFHQYFLIKQDQQLQLLQWVITVENKKMLIDIILKFCKIISYMNYIDKQLQSCQHKIIPFLLAYDRYLINLQDSLSSDDFKDGNGNDLLIYLFDLLLTNLIPEQTKDFWLNQFGERGYKKLYKLGSQMYDGLREILFVHIISCLERLCIVLNDLYAISKWLKDSNSDDETFGLNPLIINDLLNHVKLFLKRTYKLIWIINKEQDLFNNFINWLKYEIIEKIMENDTISDSNHIKEHDIVTYLNNHGFNSEIWQYFDLSLSNYEVLHEKGPSSPTKILVQSFTQLQTEFQEKLLTPFITYFKCHLKFEMADFPIKLSLQSKLHYINENHSIIITQHDTLPSLQILEFSYSNPINAFTKDINFDEYKQILTYQVYDHKIMVLLKSGQNHLYELCQITLKNRHEFDIETVSCNEKSLLNDPHHLALNAEYGCVLDGNKQNYMIFKH